MDQHLKKALRNKILQLLKNQKEDVRIQKSKLIADKFCCLPEFLSAGCVMIYSAFDKEVDTQQIRERAHTLGKKVAFPMIIKETKEIIPAVVAANEDLVSGPYGIAQPHNENNQAIELKDIDLIAVPGVAFDQKGNRLGRGQGYYDRFLRRLPDSTPSVGLAFDFQVVSSLPVVPGQDMPVSFVVAN